MTGWKHLALRTLAEIDAAAAYHCFTVGRLVESAHEKAEALAGRVEAQLREN